MKRVHWSEILAVVTIIVTYVAMAMPSFVDVRAAKSWLNDYPTTQIFSEVSMPESGVVYLRISGPVVDPESDLLTSRLDKYVGQYEQQHSVKVISRTPVAKSGVLVAYLLLTEPRLVELVGQR